MIPLIISGKGEWSSASGDFDPGQSSNFSSSMNAPNLFLRICFAFAITLPLILGWGLYLKGFFD